MTKEELLTRLTSLEISHQCIEHKAVFTCAESEEIDVAIPGAHTKQLLMRDKKKRNYVLAIVMHDKTVDTKKLGEQLGVGRLSFASPSDLMELLHVEPGSVTPFGLVFDTGHRTRIIMDDDAWNIGQFRFHPLVNTATVVIDRAGFDTFMAYTGHSYERMTIPRQ